MNHALPRVGFSSLPMLRTSIIPALAFFLVLAFGVGGVVFGGWYLLPRPGKVAVGVRVAGYEPPETMTPEAFIRQKATTLLDQPLAWQVQGRKLEVLTPRQLGLRVDEQAMLRRAMNIGRQGSLVFKLHESWKARAGAIRVPLSWTIDPTPIVDRVVLLKEDWDKAAIPARYDFVNKTVKPHEDGTYLDAYGTLDSLGRWVEAQGESLDIATMDVPPLATNAFLERLDISQRVGSFESRFGYLGGQANRAHNIATGASRLDGIVMLPGQVISFNGIVGHRTLENGFRKAWEIFKGEMVEGVGGGSCQVASTLHAAGYLAGLEIVERSPHSRPIGYIEIGLDATVVDGLVDLKLRNPFDFPIVLHSRVDKGVIVFEILGEQRPVRVTFRGEVTGTQRFKRKVQEASWLPEGKVIRKQRGIQGYTVRRVRMIRNRDGRQREEVTRDYYPPTPELYLVPPGTDPERDLPPIPGEEAPCEEPCETPERLEVEDGPAARAAPPRPSHRTVIDR